MAVACYTLPMRELYDRLLEEGEAALRELKAARHRSRATQRLRRASGLTAEPSIYVIEDQGIRWVRSIEPSPLSDVVRFVADDPKYQSRESRQWVRKHVVGVVYGMAQMFN
jgi:hypothetical protein